MEIQVHGNLTTVLKVVSQTVMTLFSEALYEGVLKNFAGNLTTVLKVDNQTVITLFSEAL